MKRCIKVTEIPPSYKCAQIHLLCIFDSFSSSSCTDPPHPAAVQQVSTPLSLLPVWLCGSHRKEKEKGKKNAANLAARRHNCHYDCCGPAHHTVCWLFHRGGGRGGGHCLHCAGATQYYHSVTTAHPHTHKHVEGLDFTVSSPLGLSVIFQLSIKQTCASIGLKNQTSLKKKKKKEPLSKHRQSHSSTTNRKQCRGWNAQLLYVWKHMELRFLGKLTLSRLQSCFSISK